MIWGYHYFRKHPYRSYSMIHQISSNLSICVHVYTYAKYAYIHIAKCYVCLGDTCLRTDAVNNMLAKASSCINVFVFATVFYCMDVVIVAAESVVKLLTGLQKPSKHLCFIVPLMIGYISKQPDRQCNSASCPSINDFDVPKWCPDVATHKIKFRISESLAACPFDNCKNTFLQSLPMNRSFQNWSKMI